MAFDPYHVWLGIPPDEQPPNHYRLLGIRAFEDNPDVIAGAADRQMTHVRTFQTGRLGAITQRILNELSSARIVLLVPEKKAAYDGELRRRSIAMTVPPYPAVEQAFPGSVGKSAPPVQYRPAPQEVELLPKVQPSPSIAEKRKQERQTLPKKFAAAIAAVIVAVGVIVGVFSMNGGRPDDDKAVAKAPAETPLVPSRPAQRVAPPSDQEPSRFPPGQPPELEKVGRGTKDSTTGATHPSGEAEENDKEERIEAEPAKRTFEEEVQRAAAEFRTRYASLKASQVEALSGSETDAVRKGALERLVQQKITLEAEQTRYEQDVRRIYGTIAEKYKDLAANKVLEAARDENEKGDPKIRSALCVLAMSKAAQVGDIASINQAMSLMNDPHFAPHQKLAIKVNLLGGKQAVLAPTTRIAVARDLVSQIQIAYDAEEYSLAGALLETAETYLKGIKIATRDRDPAKAQKGRELKQLHDRLESELASERNIMERNARLFGDYQAELGPDMQPRDAAAKYKAGIYCVTVRRDWNSALRHFAECNNPHVASAAKLETRTPLRTALEQLTVAQAWMAVDNDSQNREIWSERAAKWIREAQAQKPGGTLKLDIDILAKTLGVSPISSQANAEANVEMVVAEAVRPKYVPKEAVWNKETGSWYLLLPGKFSFEQATRLAVANSATIVVIDSKEENAFIQKMGRGEDQWLGIVKNSLDNKWYKPDSSTIDYSNWAKDEGTNLHETFVQMSPLGTWNDLTEDHVRVVVLEWKNVGPKVVSWFTVKGSLCCLELAGYRDDHFRVINVGRQ